MLAMLMQTEVHCSHTYLTHHPSHLGLEDGLVDLLDDPDKLASVDPLDKGITHILRCLRTQWADDLLPPHDGPLLADCPLQVVNRDLQEMGYHLRHVVVVNGGHRHVPSFLLCMHWVCVSGGGGGGVCIGGVCRGGGGGGGGGGGSKCCY